MLKPETFCTHWCFGDAMDLIFDWVQIQH